jgi:hypothetical protein
MKRRVWGEGVLFYELRLDPVKRSCCLAQGGSEEKNCLLIMMQLYLSVTA